MKLILCQESQPAHTVLLILPQIRLDIDRNLILLGLATIQQLHQELSFVVPLGQEFGRKAWWIGNTSFEWDHLDQRCECRGGQKPYLLVGIRHSSEGGDNQEENIG